MAINVERERAILREYEALLADAEREAQDLREIVERVRRRLARFSEAGSGTASEADEPSPVESSSDGAPGVRRRYAGRRSLPAFLVDLMSDRERRTLDQIEDAVKSDPDFADRVPARNTISTRMSELAKKPGTFDKLSDGSYQKRDGINPRAFGDAVFERMYSDESLMTDAERSNEP